MLKLAAKTLHTTPNQPCDPQPLAGLCPAPQEEQAGFSAERYGACARTRGTHHTETLL